MKYTVDYKILILFTVIFLTIILLPLILNRFSHSGQRHIGFFEKYYLADRKVSGIVLAITLMSTYGSASTFLGGPGVAYKLGYGWVLLAVIQVVTGYFVLLVLAKKFRKVAKEINAITISDYLKNRYKSNVVAYLSSLAMIVFLIAAMSAQWVGGAKLLSAFMGIEYKTGIFLISVIIIFCVVFGGLKNILITDMIQGLIMVFSTIILLYAVIHYGGGVENITNNLLLTNEKILSPFGADGSLTAKYVSSFWVLVGVGVIGIPQIAINSMLYKNKRSLKQSIIVGSIVIFIVMFGVHLIGVMARGVFPDIKDYDSVIPIITLKILPWYLAALVLAAPMAAIITTVNAQFLLISSALIKDVLFNNKAIKEKITGKKVPVFVYTINILVIILIMFISMQPPSLIVNVNLFAFGGLEATFLWPILLGLYWKYAEKYGAIMSIVFGLTSYIIFKKVYIVKSIEPVVISLIISLVVFVLISLINSKKTIEK
ncbi:MULTISPECIES: sodium/pantothenate symporter [Gemella]|uniref:sodium/pantothenate symporter n=1 Tax=Gemella TaxID=1378 RepID=UPI0007683123|nr:MULTISPECIES: sodium/pantothenate symporter [Gemella]AME09787.1 sodium/pantothenate symporter [Gemella sp. oral taxon 928]AXI27387.1 sodium/panthothenate symporter [Gemella sp. ND 6198]